MKIFINTFGSRGDVQPYVALGMGLKAAGHDVMVCTSSRFEGFIREHGLDYGHATDDLLKLMDSAEGRDAMENTVGVVGALRSNLKLAQQAKPINRQMMLDSWQAAQAFSPELVLFNPKALGASSIAEKFSAPAIMALPQPIMVPTATAPATGFPTWQLGGWYNRATYGLVHMGANTYRGMVNEFRRALLDLPSLPKSVGALQSADGQPMPVLHCYSPHVAPRPADWPVWSHVTGYWFLPTAVDWQPPAELVDFLAAGEAPVYVGFGSMAGRDPKRMTNLVVEALEQAQARGIIASGWGGMDETKLPASILKIEQAPHDWLFPRVAAVVHHGGAGSTAAGLRAGRPTVICPFFGDQPFWGARVQALGVGSAPIPQKQLTATKLATAIRTVTTDENIQKKAAALGEKICGEDGIANAIAVIATWAERYRTHVYNKE